jgi:hypothetical protein
MTSTPISLHTPYSVGFPLHFLTPFSLNHARTGRSLWYLIISLQQAVEVTIDHVRFPFQS